MRWVFRNRWFTLAWAAGICWFALQVADQGKPDGNQAAPVDITGAPVTANDIRVLKDVTGN